jgi:hypothetical protein
MSHSFDPQRRSFLIGSLALPLLPRLDAQNTPIVDAGFHLHPHYRAQTALDATLLKTKAGLDAFITERYHDQIAAILAGWRANLLQSAKNLQAIEKVLAPSFRGSSFRPAESGVLSMGSVLEVV